MLKVREKRMVPGVKAIGAVFALVTVLAVLWLASIVAIRIICSAGGQFQFEYFCQHLGFTRPFDMVLGWDKSLVLAVVATVSALATAALRGFVNWSCKSPEQWALDG